MDSTLQNIIADKSRIELILDFLPYPFIISERQGSVQKNIYANKKFLNEIGYSLDEIPDIDAWFEKAYPEPLYRGIIATGWNDLVQDALQKGEADAMMRVIIRTKHNGDRWYEVKSSVRNSLQMVAFVNITEVMLKEHELQRLNENKNQTLSILAHDIRGPLTNLNTMTRMMLEGNFEANEFLHRLSSIHEKSSQVLEFIETTLLWTRTNFNSMSINIQDVDFDQALSKILQIYSNIYQAKGITIKKNIGTSTLRSDPEVLTILLRNLISNAIKFSYDNGEITIRVTRESDGYMVCVKDRGVGMSAETMDRLQRDHHTTTIGTREEKGLGLGLKLCRELLKKIGGELYFQSEPGAGTEVSFLLRASQDA